MGLEERALSLDNVIENFELSGLETDSPFYVDIDDARNGDEMASVRQRIIKEMERCYRKNQTNPDKYVYRKLLFVGHKAAGKTTELHRIRKELDDKYEIIFIGDIEKQQDRLAEQPDFIYFIVESLIRYCEANSEFGRALENEIKKLQKYLQEKIFGELTEVWETGIAGNIETEAEGRAEVRFPVLNLFARLSSKATLLEEHKKQLNTKIRLYINDFLEITNAILQKMQSEALKSNKMILIILDGLDKVREEIAEEIFLSSQSFLTKLDCSMIVTFPLYLNYSPKYDQAISPFDGRPFILSVVPVHERNGSDCQRGIQALQSIVEKRMDIDLLLENPEEIKEVICNSGGNLRDLFTFIREAAINADIMDKTKIQKSDLEIAYQRKQNELSRQLVREYVNALDQVYHDKEKETIIAENPSDDTLLMMFNAGLLIEYNGRRWVDLHPLMKQLISEKIRKNIWKN